MMQPSVTLNDLRNRARELRALIEKFWQAADAQPYLELRGTTEPPAERVSALCEQIEASPILKPLHQDLCATIMVLAAEAEEYSRDCEPSALKEFLGWLSTEMRLLTEETRGIPGCSAMVEEAGGPEPGAGPLRMSEA